MGKGRGRDGKLEMGDGRERVRLTRWMRLALLLDLRRAFLRLPTTPTGELPPLITNYLTTRFAMDGQGGRRLGAVGRLMKGCIERGLCVLCVSLIWCCLSSLFFFLVFFLLKKQGDDGVSVGWWLSDSIGVGVGLGWLGLGGELWFRKSFGLFCVFSSFYLQRSGCGRLYITIIIDCFSLPLFALSSGHLRAG